jgi:hypothetical protein
MRRKGHCHDRDISQMDCSTQGARDSVAKLILSVANPLAGQPEVALAFRAPVAQECSVLQLEAGNTPAPAFWLSRER